jgi:transcriptional regulator with XRE-family HTH domain
MAWRRELGAQIRFARESAGVSQGELAKHLGVTRQMIGRYESGRAAPGVDKIAKAASLLRAEFVVHGYRISSVLDSRVPKLSLIPHQLSLEYEKPHTSKHSLVRITPRKGKLVIYAEVPA